MCWILQVRMRLLICVLSDNFFLRFLFHQCLSINKNMKIQAKWNPSCICMFWWLLPGSEDHLLLSTYIIVNYIACCCVTLGKCALIPICFLVTRDISSNCYDFCPLFELWFNIGMKYFLIYCDRKIISLTAILQIVITQNAK